MALSIWTLGHSTRTADEFRQLLIGHGLELVVDVRRFPGSRRLPQFSSRALEADLEGAGLLYKWIPQLGGRRKTSARSSDSPWRNASFQAYADHTGTEEFAEGLEELLMLANGARTAIMCAEVLWWRCHRRLIADVLVALGAEVFHIMGAEPAPPHRIAPPARIVRGELTYSA